MDGERKDNPANRKANQMYFNRKIAISAISAAAILGTGGIAYANVTPSPTPTPSVTPTVNPLPAGCYRATDIETVIARGHAPVREVVRAIVCRSRFGPVVFVDTNAGPFGLFGR